MLGEGEELKSYSACSVCHDAVEQSEMDLELNVCMRCVERSKLRRESADARNKAKAALRDMVKLARPDAIMAPHISEVCAGIVRELGGVERLCEEIVEDWRDARERAPGSATVIRFGESIMRLVRDSSALRESAPDAINLKDDELAGEMLALMERAVRDKGIEMNEDTITDLFLGDSSGQQDPQEIERTGEGEPGQEEGSSEVLPSDE